MRNYLKVWGDNIENKGVNTRKYISYRINKEFFNIIGRYMNDNINFSEIDYIEMICDQTTKRMSVELCSFNEDAEKIFEIDCPVAEFFKLIAHIESEI